MRELLDTVDMHPMQFAMHAHARLVHMQKPSREQLLFEPLHPVHQSCRGLLDPLAQGCLRDRTAKGLFQDVAGPLHGHQVVLIEVDPHGCHPRSIVHRGFDLFWKGPSVPVMALRTVDLFDLMFLNLHADLGQLPYLAPFHHLPSSSFEFGLTVLSVIWAMPLDRIWRLAHLQCHPSMTPLPSARTPTPL